MPECVISKRSNLIKLYEQPSCQAASCTMAELSGLVLWLGRPPLVTGKTSYSACIKAVACGSHTLPSEVRELVVDIVHGLPEPSLRFKVQGTLRLQGAMLCQRHKLHVSYIAHIVPGYNATTIDDETKAVLKATLATHLMTMESRITISAVGGTQSIATVEYEVLAETIDEASDLEASSVTIQEESTEMTHALQEKG